MQTIKWVGPQGTGMTFLKLLIFKAYIPDLENKTNPSENFVDI